MEPDLKAFGSAFAEGQIKVLVKPERVCVCVCERQRWFGLYLQLRLD